MTFLVVQLLATEALAAAKLQVYLTQPGLKARSEAPIPVDVRFRWDNTLILEGRLEVELCEGNRVLSQYLSGELALTTGEQTYHMLLPPCVTPYSDSQVEARMKFITAKGPIDLDPSSLFMPNSTQRSLVLAWCNPRTSMATPELEQTMELDRYAPQSEETGRRESLTSLVRLAPEDLPAQPLAYTAYDVVVMTSDAFAEANEARLRALARWVKGGGSVCVFVNGGLQSHQLWFLNEVGEAASGGPRFFADNNGFLAPGEKKVWKLRSGAGRSVIVDKSISDPHSAEWQDAVLFLWKVRGRQVQAIGGNGHWDVMTQEAIQNALQASRWRRTAPGQYDPTEYYIGGTSYRVLPAAVGGELLNQLMPKTVRLIPFSALLGMLGSFLLLIGPADYFVLGFFRRRRYTWILFPVTSLAFMLATVLMANHYLGLRDQRRSLIVVDLDKDGSAVRWNQYELVYAARDKLAVTDLKDALWARLQAEDMFSPYRAGWTSYQPVRRPTGPDESVPRYEGVVPVHFLTSEMIHQWQPQLNRIFSFEPPAVPLPSNWPEVEGAWPDVQAVRMKLSSNRRFVGDICTISGTNSPVYDGDSKGIVPSYILEELCRGDSLGFFSVVSQISPTGGANFEDALGMDGEAGDSTLAIVVEQGDDIIVYRRFFHGS